MTYSEMTNIPTPSYLQAGNVIRFSTNYEEGDNWEGIGMIVDSFHDYYGRPDGEFRVEAVRYCLDIKCNDGMVRHNSLYYIRVKHQTSPLAVQFEDGLYEPDESDGASDLIISEIFDC